jgi:hypothetical protein
MTHIKHIRPNVKIVLFTEYFKKFTSIYVILRTILADKKFAEALLESVRKGVDLTENPGAAERRVRFRGIFFREIPRKAGGAGPTL